jgi:hypothetical protein
MAAPILSAMKWVDRKGLPAGLVMLRIWRTP